MSGRNDGKVVSVKIENQQPSSNMKYQLLNEVPLYHEKPTSPTRKCTNSSKTGFSRCTNIVLSGSFIVSVLLLACVTYMYTEQIKLKSEIATMQNNLLSALELIHQDQDQGKKEEEFESMDNAIIIPENSAEVEQDLISQTDAEQSGGVLLRRSKRADRSKGGNSRRSSNNNRRNEKKRSSGRNSGDTDSHKLLMHMIINERHEHAQINNNELKTGERGDVIPFWKFSDNDYNYDQEFGVLNEPRGSVTIKKSGLYFIYSQMTYFDRSGRWSHTINLGDRPFVKCLTSEWGIETDPETGVHYNTIQQCYTAAVTHISANKEVTIRGMYPDRVIHPDTEMTFWGIVKLA